MTPCFYCDGARPAVWPETREEFASCEECREERSARNFEREQAAFFGADGPSEQDRADYNRDTGRHGR